MLTDVENKIPIINNLFKKTDYNAKITEIEDKITKHKQMNILQHLNLIN